MYLTHKYWARKPHNVVAEYIDHYTRRNEIVLDCFAGSGVTVFEALRLERRAIGIDLDPLSILTMNVTIQTTDLSALDQAFETITRDVSKRLQELYDFECPKCHKTGTIRYVVWSYLVNCPSCGHLLVMGETSRPKEKRQNIYKCPHCRQEFSYANVPITGEKPVLLEVFCPNCEEVSVIENPKYEPLKASLASMWYPKIHFVYKEHKPFGTKRRAERIEELFTDRNLYALALLYESIQKVSDETVKRALVYVFSSMIPQASRLVPWRRGFLTGGPAWTIPEYLILPVHCEFNVWSRFENRFRSMIRGVKDRNERLPQTLNEAQSFEQLQNNQGQYYIKRMNAIELTQEIPPDSIDYVFTDPPYGGAIQYFELDLIRVAWILGKEFADTTDQWWKEEITVNRGQQKNFDYYHKMLSASFAQIYCVLKPGRVLTVTFHSTDIDVWNSIISAVKMAGFKLEKIIYQPPAVRSAKASLQPYGSAVGDYYIRFSKPKDGRQTNNEKADREKYRRVVIESAKKIIARRGEPTPITFILNGIIPELDKHGVFFVDGRGSRGIEEVLKGRLNVDFTLKPIIDKSGKMVGQGWWFMEPSAIPYLETVPLSERVEKLVINILNERIKLSYDEVLQQVFITFPNALTPNTQSVKEVLEEYASQTPDKKWILQPKFKEQISRHDELIKELADLGKQLGFDVHADIDGYRKTEFPFEVEDQNRVAEIDVVWYSKQKALAEFEVENTTGITEAIIRGGNIKATTMIRTLVIPEERNRLLKRRVREPLLRELVVKYDWLGLTYGQLDSYIEKHKRKKPELGELRRLMFRLKDFKTDVQGSLTDFISTE